MDNPTQPTSSLTDEELADLKAQISFEEQRRLRVERLPDQIKELNRQLLNDLSRRSGEPWAQPEGWWDSYPEGWIVKHKGLKMRSLCDGNIVAPPDTAAWQVTLGSDD
jgi:hypothetical protein